MRIPLVLYAAYAAVMLLIIGPIRLPPENRAAARPVMKRMAEISRGEAGCMDYVYAEDVFEPGLIHVKEMWANQLALDRHFNAAHLHEWRSTWASLGIGERHLQVYEVGAPRST